MSNIEKRDYSSNYSIKDFIRNSIAPKYFDFDDVDDLNVGIFGYLADVESSTSEDISNIISIYAKEIFPNLAEIPESIYSYAGAYNVTDLLATPASARFVLFISENDIIKNGIKNGQYYEYYLDSGTTIIVEDYSFVLDYDIKITYRYHRGELVFSAMYHKEFTNSIANTNDPYIRIKRITYNAENFIGLMIHANRVNVSEELIPLISNDKINAPKATFRFEDSLCNFEVLYKAPDSETYIQLEKRFYRAEPSKNPFCFFRYKDVDKIEISFTSRDGYFQPKFNGELLIKKYTGNGSKDNFPLYTGDAIFVQPRYHKYIYNQNLIMLALIQTACTGGCDAPTLDEIRELYLIKMRTVDSYTTENDLQIYFNEVRKKLGNEVKFIKKRDDVAYRLFSAFSLMKDKNGDIYHTNTVNLITRPEEMIEYDTAFILKPGTVYDYSGRSRIDCRLKPDLTIYDKAETKEQFYYTCPYLIYLHKEQESISYFYNSINETILLDYSYSNTNCVVQFIANMITVYRNSIQGEMEYKIKLNLSVSTTQHNPIIDPETDQDLGTLKVKMILPNSFGNDVCAIDFKILNYNQLQRYYELEATIKTNDRITINNEMEILDTYLVDSGEYGTATVPINTGFKLMIFYKPENENETAPRKVMDLPDLDGHLLTNVYTNEKGRTLDLMLSVKSCRSNLTYIPRGENDYEIIISHLPSISTTICHDEERLQYLVDSLKSQHLMIESLMTKVTNSFSVDMKFYNTYGRSNHFTVGEDEKLLDRVNCRIKFKVSPAVGCDEGRLVTNIRSLIKNFIESINETGYNSFYVSNCITLLEESLDDIMYLKFISINEYDSMAQVIDNKGLDLMTVSREELREYVPEFLTVQMNDIEIEIITPNNTKTIK